ncbi:tRNA methyltransferase 10 [Blomia tropicalis]|nr:tRNA methyltransferase 10 [Blomia tropicalis]
MFHGIMSVNKISDNDGSSEIKETLSQNKAQQDAKLAKVQDGIKLSKKQMKRMLKHEKWIATKSERKKREKEKRKAKIARKKEAGELILSRKQIKSQLVPQRDSPCKVAVVIDCDYADYMNDLEIKKLCKQLNRCYAINKHNPKPVQLYITSISGKLKTIFETYQSGYKNWDCVCSDKHWFEIFMNNNGPGLEPNLIYLSGDSENTVGECSEIQQLNNAIFIIGGLIDHNRHKGLALERAKQNKVNHAQLPINDHIQMTQRRILAIPHVFEIMLYAANGTIGQCWPDIFQKVIPIRKLASGDEQ